MSVPETPNARMTENFSIIADSFDFGSEWTADHSLIDLAYPFFSSSSHVSDVDYHYLMGGPHSGSSATVSPLGVESSGIEYTGLDQGYELFTLGQKELFDGSVDLFSGSNQASLGIANDLESSLGISQLQNPLDIPNSHSIPCYVPPLEGYPFIETPGTSQSPSVSSYSDFSLPSPSALLATLPPTHPKQKGQRSTIDESVLLHAFTDQSPHPDPRRRSLLDAVMHSPFYHEHQHEPRLDAIDAELFAILWDFPSFVVAPSKNQSIFSLFVDPGRRECMICAKTHRTSDRALGCIRKHLGHRPFWCGGEKAGCTRCSTSRRVSHVFPQSVHPHHIWKEK
ncbi:hypothetical protein FRC17_006065 [Serendipita sp. 399]|nr:hypothetical protein FRC17_006065 [Serendipita sp. 399]